MSYGIGGCCPQCGGEPLTAGFAHRAECPTLRTNAVYPVGDRSLLRAPTEPSAAAIEAVARELFTRRQPAAKWPGPYSEQGQRLFREDARSLLKIAYAVDGLRGTEDRAAAARLAGMVDELRAFVDDTLRRIVEIIDEPRHTQGERMGARMAHRAVREAFASVLRESVEGEQRGTHGGD